MDGWMHEVVAKSDVRTKRCKPKEIRGKVIRGSLLARQDALGEGFVALSFIESDIESGHRHRGPLAYLGRS